MKVLLLALFAMAIPCEDGVKWTAVQTAGPQRDCWDGAMNVRWDIMEKGGSLLFQANNSVSVFKINISSLNPDGSGRIDVKDGKGRPAWFELEAGHGPRKIRANWGYRACVWLLTPR
jgi:hypothetical protein